jgi:hypothetical protein
MFHLGEAVQHSVFFWGGAQILCCSQSGNNPQENLAIFSCKLNMNFSKKKEHLLYFWLTYLKPSKEI